MRGVARTQAQTRHARAQGAGGEIRSRRAVGARAVGAEGPGFGVREPRGWPLRVQVGRWRRAQRLRCAVLGSRGDFREETFEWD